MSKSSEKGRAHYSACRLAAEGRRFFTTESGFMDLTSPSTEAGDIVVIFLRGITPFIVRESKGEPGKLVLVGELCVHGITYGEAMKSRKIETFLLRRRLPWLRNKCPRPLQQ